MYTVFTTTRYIDGHSTGFTVLYSTEDLASARSYFNNLEIKLQELGQLGKSFFRRANGVPTLIQGGYETTLHMCKA